jgi:hypothetical protein
MVGLSLDCCVAPDNGISLSLTHPPTATQSAATASNVPADFIQTDFDMSFSLSRPGAGRFDARGRLRLSVIFSTSRQPGRRT